MEPTGTAYGSYPWVSLQISCNVGRICIGYLYRACLECQAKEVERDQSEKGENGVYNTNFFPIEVERFVRFL
jgi:hypothetical protein